MPARARPSTAPASARPACSRSTTTVSTCRPGRQPVLVTVPVAHPVETTSCQGATITEVATGRTWRVASLVLGWTPGAGQQETCRSETGAAVDFAAPFLLNADASGPFVVTMSVMRDGTVVDLRFDVDLTGG